MRLHGFGHVMLAALVVGSLAGCGLDEGDEGGDDDTVDTGTVDSEVVIGVGNVGCGRLFRKTRTSQNVYLMGCGGYHFGIYYRVLFSSYSRYFCFIGRGTQFVGQQADIVGGPIQMSQIVDQGWCQKGFPSNYSTGG